MSEKPIPGRFYRHYKGGLYVVEGIAKHTETDEALVIYRHVGGGLYARPLSVWMEPVPMTGEDVYGLGTQTIAGPRFVMLDANFKVSG